MLIYQRMTATMRYTNIELTFSDEIPTFYNFLMVVQLKSHDINPWKKIWLVVLTILKNMKVT